jgi:hypothetical protein
MNKETSTKQHIRAFAEMSMKKEDEQGDER